MNAPLPYFPDDNSYDNIADGLTQQGHILIPNYFPEEFSQELHGYVHNLPADEFTSAGIGPANNNHINKQIRKDKTHWLSQHHTIEKKYLALMNECRLQLNKRLYLNLKSYEAHISHYAIGSYYQRHCDAFKGQSNRIVTSLFYLNHNWSQADGGELIMYQGNTDNALCSILPTFGTMLFFLSEQFPHEVLISNRERYSIAGWFHVDSGFQL